MGLDMYFYARKGDYKDFSKLDKADGKVDETNYPKDLKAFSGYIYDRNYKSAQTKTDYQIGYFRKFNALHNYIVNTFAYGVDECQDIFLYKEDVEKIKKVLDEVLEAHTKEKAKELLPTKSGFFFGDTGYGDDYFEVVKDASDLMRKILDNFNFENYSLVYSASW